MNLLGRVNFNSKKGIKNYNLNILKFQNYNKVQ